MPDLQIDPELRIGASPPIVLRRTAEAIEFIRRMALSSPNRAWEEVLQNLEAARDEWTAMEAVVHLELLLEAGGLLIEKGTAYASPPRQDPSRAPQSLGSRGGRTVPSDPDLPRNRGPAVAACKAQASEPQTKSGIQIA